MIMIWFIGFIAFIAYRVFNAGMNSKSLFYVTKTSYNYDTQRKETGLYYEGEKVFGYVLITLVFAVTWPLSLPAMGIYLLGKRYAK